MLKKIKISDLGKKSWRILNWIETENRSVGYATLNSLKFYVRKDKKISIKELQEILPHLADKTLITIEG